MYIRMYIHVRICIYICIQVLTRNGAATKKALWSQVYI